jgi:hypothetical protein
MLAELWQFYPSQNQEVWQKGIEDLCSAARIFEKNIKQ